MGFRSKQDRVSQEHWVGWGAWSERDWMGEAVPSFPHVLLLGLPRAQSYLYISSSPWHLAAIMGEQIAAPSPSLGSRHSWGLPHLPHQHRTQLGVPRAMLPKTQRGREPRRAQTPEIDTLTPLPTDTPQSEATPTNTRSLVCRLRTGKHAITQPRLPPPLSSRSPLSFLSFPLKLPSVTKAGSELS